MKLFISYAYSHEHSSAGRRARLLNEIFMKKSGWRVITSDLSVNDESNVETIRTKISSSFKPISYKKSGFKLFVKKVAGYFLWPDRGIFWSWKAYFRISKMIKEHNPENLEIVALAYPFSSILLGALLKKNFSKKSRFTAHFIDGFYLINFGNGTSFWFRPLNYLAERFVYRYSNQIILNKFKEKDFRSTFPDMISKAIFVDELPGNLFNINRESKVQDRYFFAGSLYLNIRNPEALLEIFALLDDRHLILAGNTNDCDGLFKAYTKSNIDHIGMIDHVELEAEYSKCEFLVNIDNQDTAQQPPGKIIEYMMLQKPIINFYKGTSISKEVLLTHAKHENAFIEINLDDDAKNNADKIKNFSFTQGQLFKVKSPFKTIEKIYNAH